MYECIYIYVCVYIYIYVYMYVYVYFQLIILAYKDEQQKLQITLCKKNTDKQSYLHAKSKDPVSLKKYTVQSNTGCQKNLLNKQRIRAQL